MSEANKGATTGGQDGPSDSGIPAIESIAQISSHLARVAVGRDGKLHANAEIQIALRDKDGRSKILEQLIREVCPDGVSGAKWRAWLVGGSSPFDVQPKKAAPGKERPSDRQSDVTGKSVAVRVDCGGRRSIKKKQKTKKISK